jgi:HK97 family phage major capsid protein
METHRAPAAGSRRGQVEDYGTIKMAITFAELKSMGQRRRQIADGAGAILTRAHQANRPLTAEERLEVERRYQETDQLGAEYDRAFDEYERSLGANGPRIPNENPDVPASRRSAGREDYNRPMTRRLAPGEDAPEVRQAFRSFLLTGQLQNSQDLVPIGPGHTRAMSDVTGSQGAYTVPQGFVYKLEVALKYYGGILQAAEYIPTDTGNLLPYPIIDDTGNTGEVIAENTVVAGGAGDGTGENDPVFSVKDLNAYMHDSGIVLVPLTLLQDSAFDVESYMLPLLSTRIGRKLNNGCTVGTGGGTMPTGVVTSAQLGITGASPTTFSYSELLRLEHSIDPAYRVRSNPKCGFMFSDAAFLQAKLLVDGNGRPLWIAGGVSEGIQNARPDTIDGFPYWINQDVAAPGSSAKSILFGDFSKFKIRQVREVHMTRLSERYAERLMVGFIAFLRADSALTLPSAIKYFQHSAT